MSAKQSQFKKLPAGPECPKRPPRSLLFLFIIISILPHVFPESFPNRLGEHMVRLSGEALAHVSATPAFPTRKGSLRLATEALSNS